MLSFFYENKNIFSNAHPLRYKYFFPLTVRKIKHLDDYIQILCNSVFIRKELLKDFRFSNLIKPSFEDGFFINTLFLENEEKSICFLKEAKYFHRKRQNLSSLTDKYWEVEERYKDCLLFGSLRLLDLSTNDNKRVPPLYIQHSILYETYWFFTKLKNNDELVAKFGEKTQKEFLNLLFSIYQRIEPSLFKQFPCRYRNEELNTAIAFFTRRVADVERVVNITKYDNSLCAIRCQFLIKDRKEEYHFYIDNAEVLPIDTKTVSNSFCGQDFSLIKLCWISLPSCQSGNIRAVVGGKEASLAIKNKKKTVVRVSDIFNNFILLKRYLLPPSHFNNCWLIFDRVSHADDNGEHFYRFLRHRAPYINAWFILSKGCSDWIRLEKEGFKLIEYGSTEHKTALQYCSKIISSHLDQEQLKPFDDRVDKKIPFIFLQHGVTKDDLSDYFNRAEIAFLITSTQEERNSIVCEKSRYQLTSKEVLLTGLPRYDSLLTNTTPRKKVILISPTWRSSIVHSRGGSSEKNNIQNFFQSQYAQAWNSLLNNPYMLELLEAYGYIIKFFPHPKIQPFLKGFYFQERVEPCTYDSCRVQDMLLEASLLITDYSSIAFDFAYLEKGVIYYQFDEGKIFQTGSHTYKKGYYDYSKDGFGPVVLNEKDLIKELTSILSKHCQVDPIYLDRMKKTFPIKDGKNCERLFKSIYSKD